MELKKLTTTLATTFVVSVFSGITIADEIGHEPGNGTNDATDPNNTEVVGTSETNTLETWWNELLEDLGFVTPDDEAGIGND